MNENPNIFEFFHRVYPITDYVNGSKMFTQNYGQNWCFTGQFDLKQSKNSPTVTLPVALKYKWF